MHAIRAWYLGHLLLKICISSTSSLAELHATFDVYRPAETPATSGFLIAGGKGVWRAPPATRLLLPTNNCRQLQSSITRIVSCTFLYRYIRKTCRHKKRRIEHAKYTNPDFAVPITHSRIIHLTTQERVARVPQASPTMQKGETRSVQNRQQHNRSPHPKDTNKHHNRIHH